MIRRPLANEDGISYTVTLKYIFIKSDQCVYKLITKWQILILIQYFIYLYTGYENDGTFSAPHNSVHFPQAKLREIVDVEGNNRLAIIQIVSKYRYFNIP